MSDSIEQLLEDLRAFVRDAEAVLSSSAGLAGEGLHESRARAEQALGAAKERLTKVQEEFLGRARDAVDAGEAYLRDYPWQALALAAGVGFLFGAMLSRRRGSAP
jgi:ElaB/YqjD/DUF883 family membrane-anchored ribosome-binding protein